MTNILLGYDDSEGCNLRGFYDPDVHAKIPHKTISVTDRQRSSIRKNKLLWRVENGQLVKLSGGNFVHKKRPAKRLCGLVNISFKGSSYKVDSNLSSTVALNLSICLFDLEHSCLIWCSSDEVWQYKKHSKSDLLGLSKELNSAREDHSRKLYGDLL